MSRILDPFQFLLIAIAGWMNHKQLQVIEYLREENRVLREENRVLREENRVLREENRVLREQLGDRRLRFNDDQRRRLAVRAKGLGPSCWRKSPAWSPRIP